MFITSIAYSQQYSPPPRDYTNRNAIDNCNLVVTYNYEYIVDTLEMKRYHEPMILEIGNNVNRFYSYNSDLRDSINYNNLKKRNKKGVADGVPSIPWFAKNQSTTYLDIHTYHQKERLISTKFHSTDYQYKEPIYQLDWNILPEKDTVLGYLCHKAETEFRGHKWIVWFASEIPYNYGPWKLGGLPGLILKAQDSDKLFIWTAIGIEQPKNCSIYIYEDKSGSSGQHLFRKSERKGVAKLWQRMWLNPISLYLSAGVRVYVNNGGAVKEQKSMHISNKYYPKLELDL